MALKPLLVLYDDDEALLMIGAALYWSFLNKISNMVSLLKPSISVNSEYTNWSSINKIEVNLKQRLIGRFLKGGKNFNYIKTK